MVAPQCLLFRLALPQMFRVRNLQLFGCSDLRPFSACLSSQQLQLLLTSP